MAFPANVQIAPNGSNPNVPTFSWTEPRSFYQQYGTSAGGAVVNSVTATVTVTGGGPGSDATGDGPLPLWALGALGAGLFGVARGRLKKAA